MVWAVARLGTVARVRLAASSRCLVEFISGWYRASRGSVALRKTGPTFHQGKSEDQGCVRRLRESRILRIICGWTQGETHIAMAGAADDRTSRLLRLNQQDTAFINQAFQGEGQERSQQGFKRRKRAHEFLNLHARITYLHHSRASVSASTRQDHQRKAFQTWSTITAGVV